MEISASGDSSIFSSVPDLDFTNVVLVSTSFGRLMLFLAGGTDGFRPFEVLTPVIRVYEPFKVCDPFCTHFIQLL
jgi:hypothetical protein